MTSLGITYAEINVEENPDEAMRLVEEGWRAMPVVIDQETDAEWGGFRRDLIENMVD
jgi:glutaredoxin